MAAASSDCAEITDRTHPLFGRRFPIVYVARGDVASSHVFLRYDEDITLRIPVAATSLCELAPSTLQSKLSTPAVEEFLALVKEYELCPTQTKSKQGKSGRRSRRKIRSESRKHSNKS